MIETGAPAAQTIGILGAGRVGTALARLALAAGYEVRMATSRAPSEIELLLKIITPGAVAATAEEVALGSDIVVLALPLFRYRTLRPDLLAGKVVVDVMNYWSPTDGRLEEFEGEEASSEVIQRFLPDARLVRSFNHMGYHEIEGEARAAGALDRRALAIAADDSIARQAVADFIDRLGYDPVDAGPLRSARNFGAGTPIFGASLARDELIGLLGAASEPAGS
ncbi:NADPH-dependent F420 reductase [Paradevosia shaoguanensis]|uniref:NADPH-dependent F420 reductase n=1 Tax=Paradevosia shaoguanensis TaxID=1335043 RepID=UPI001933B115|nr:NAD(P)-binding domain-containing protein [Paradevosia shaoguanensis]